MNTHSQNRVMTGICSAVAIGPLLAATLILLPGSASAADSFQEKALFSPHKSLLTAEARGRIMIYDGLESKVIDKAMDEQFDRIDHMMFTRIHHESEEGDGGYVDDDGC